MADEVGVEVAVEVVVGVVAVVGLNVVKWVYTAPRESDSQAGTS